MTEQSGPNGRSASALIGRKERQQLSELSEPWKESVPSVRPSVRNESEQSVSCGLRCLQPVWPPQWRLSRAWWR